MRRSRNVSVREALEKWGRVWAARRAQVVHLNPDCPDAGPADSLRERTHRAQVPLNAERVCDRCTSEIAERLDEDRRQKVASD